MIRGPGRQYRVDGCAYLRQRPDARPTPTAPSRPHPTATAPLASRDRDRYQRVIQARAALRSSWHRVTIAATQPHAADPTERPGRHDHPERPSVQRMASSPAQGQEDVAAPARPAVRRRPLDDLPADPRRPDAVPRAPRPSSPAACASCATTPTRRSTSASSPPASTNPTARVEYALRADELLSEPQVRQIMEYYLAVRMRRYGRAFQADRAVGSTTGRGPTDRRARTRRRPTVAPARRARPPAATAVGAAVSTVRPVTRSAGREPGRY